MLLFTPPCIGGLKYGKFKTCVLFYSFNLSHRSATHRGSSQNRPWRKVVETLRNFSLGRRKCSDVYSIDHTDHLCMLMPASEGLPKFGMSQVTQELNTIPNRRCSPARQRCVFPKFVLTWRGVPQARQLCCYRLKWIWIVMVQVVANVWDD